LIDKDFTRRSILVASAMTPLLTSTTACAQADPTAATRNATILVAYFSRSGNTRVIAGTLQRALQADLIEIVPTWPYPDDYDATVEQARQERDANYEPPLLKPERNINSYDTVYLGFPVWGGTTPPVIRTFLRSYNLAGKVIFPFITHGGYGVGNSRAVLTSHAPGARIETPFILEADQERRTIDRVRKWLGSVQG
jgi:flavodoxin